MGQKVGNRECSRSSLVHSLVNHLSILAYDEQCIVNIVNMWQCCRQVVYTGNNIDKNE